MIRHPISVARLATSAAIVFAAYLVLLGDLMWQVNIWHRPPTTVSTQLASSLQSLTVSAADLEPDAEFQLACPEPDDDRPPILGTWETRLHGEARRVVFRGAPAVQSPGASEAEVQLFG